MSSAVKPDEIVNAARAYVGIPYRHQGRTRRGLDCVGLLIRCAHDLNISDFDINGYSRIPSGAMMSRLMAEQMDRLNDSAYQCGDVLHMAFDRQPQHIAIVSNLSPLRIIHADSVAGAVVEHSLDQQWLARVRGHYRLRNG